MAGKKRTTATPLQLACAEKFEAIVALVETGATVPEAVARVSNSLQWDAFRKWCRVRPEHLARMNAAQRARDAGPNAVHKRPGRKKPPPQAAPVRDALQKHLGGIVAAIEAGTELSEAVKICGYDYGSVKRWINRDVSMRGRIASAADVAREQSTFSAANYQRALEEMVAWDATLHKARFAGISYGGIYQRAETDAGFKVQYDDAIARRNARLGIVHVRRTEEEKQAIRERRLAWHARIAKVRADRVPPPTSLTAYELRRPLLENEVYRKASAILRLNADSQDAEDIRSDAILAMLENREFTQRELSRDHHRKVSSAHMISIDEELAVGVGVLDQYRTDNILWGA